LKALGDYIHGNGLKFGIYSDAGIRTCGERAGSRGQENQDAAQYAAWGADYLKFDCCLYGRPGRRRVLRNHERSPARHRPANCLEQMRVGTI
jgi:alpha-galactosidase